MTLNYDIDPVPKEAQNVHFHFDNETVGPFNADLVKIGEEPVYGWNPLRWLFRRPKYFNQIYSINFQPQGGGEAQGTDTDLDNDDAKA